MPDVSVVIPTYNRLDFLKTAIASCFDGNDGVDIEVVVVDDGSTDGTCEWLRKQRNPRVRPIFQEQKGAQHARNAGLDVAQGETIKFLDDDDQLVEGALQDEVRLLKQSGAGVGYGDLRIQQEGANQSVFQQRKTQNLIAGIFDGAIWTHPHVFIYKRSVLESVSWDTNLSYEQDKDFAIRVAAKKPKVIYLNRPVGIFNIHDGDRISNLKSNTSVVERCLRRIRLIERGLSEMQEHGLIGEQERQAAARGMWRSAYMFAPYDIEMFENVWVQIETIAPGFCPNRSVSILSVSDKLIGPLHTERIINPFRKLKNRLSTE